MNTADHMAQRRAYREQNGKVYVEAIRSADADYEDEAVLNVSHNGYQYTATVLSRLEAEKVVAALTEHFKLGAAK